MADDPQDETGATGFSRRRLLASLGLLTLVGIAGSSLLTADDAEARGKKKKAKKRHPVFKKHPSKRHPVFKRRKKVVKKRPVFKKKIVFKRKRF